MRCGRGDIPVNHTVIVLKSNLISICGEFRTPPHEEVPSEIWASKQFPISNTPGKGPRDMGQGDCLDPVGAATPL